MDENNELQIFCDNQLAELEVYLENELKRVKDANNQYLSVKLAEFIEQAKDLFEKSNKVVFESFDHAKIEIDKLKEKNFPKAYEISRRNFAKNDLSRSLEFNKELFEQSVTYYKKLLG